MTESADVAVARQKGECLVSRRLDVTVDRENEMHIFVKLHEIIVTVSLILVVIETRIFASPRMCQRFIPLKHLLSRHVVALQWSYYVNQTLMLMVCAMFIWYMFNLYLIVLVIRVIKDSHLNSCP